MKIAFTGTRRGMTAEQKSALKSLLRSFQKDSLVFECHHGDCVGADDEFADLCAEVYRCCARIVCHPPLDETRRAFNKKHNDTRPAKTHFARNRDIVDEGSVLIAAPCDMEEQDRGGTWYTVRYARKNAKPIFILWPDGLRSEE